MTKRQPRAKGPVLRVTRASVTFDKILDEAGPMASAIRARFHRTELWRLRTGRRVACLDTAAEIERLTSRPNMRARIPAEWWLAPAKEAA